MTLHLTVVTISWFVALAFAIAAILISLEEEPRRTVLAATLASVALTIGYLGFGRWSPFRFFPQVGWIWSEGDERIYLASGWFFVAPLLLGSVAIALLVFQRLAARRQLIVR